MTEPTIHSYDSADVLADAAARDLGKMIGHALAERGRASVMLSGGSSPKATYDRMMQAQLVWDGVGIGLVDERWVPPGAVGSNADFIRSCMDGTPAERAQFVPLYNGHETAADGLEAAEQTLALMAQPFDVCVMGMGSDGHTASWFPRSGGLNAALGPDTATTVCAVDATGCPVAGDHTDRISLTYSAVARARHVVLLLPSAEKAAIFSRIAGDSLQDAPVNALRRLGPKLSVYTLESRT
ncbi:MAG: 6-phosphogluconolactonase [Litorimonas sp.]